MKLRELWNKDQPMIDDMSHLNDFSYSDHTMRRFKELCLQGIFVESGLLEADEIETIAMIAGKLSIDPIYDPSPSIQRFIAVVVMRVDCRSH